MSRTYLYGIIEATNEAALGIPGVDGATPVHTLAGDGLGCVVSDYTGPELRSLPREELLRYLLRHQQVVEQVMPRHTVLPVKFGTTLDSLDEVSVLLAQAHRALVKALDSMRGKVELEVAATWHVKGVLEAVSHDEEVVRAREAIAAKASLTVKEKVHLGQIVKACMDRRRDAYRERMLALLQPVSAGVALNALVSEEMVMNVAFLVEQTRQREFDERVQEMDDLFHNEVAFRVIGPLPPYSFSTVAVNRLTREQIADAQHILGTHDPLSESEIRRAYRRLAAREQRKALPGTTRASGDELTRLRQASEVLLACCRMGGDGNGGCGFTITVRGTGHQEIEAARFGGTVKV